MDPGIIVDELDELKDLVPEDAVPEVAGAEEPIVIPDETVIITDDIEVISDDTIPDDEIIDIEEEGEGRSRNLSRFGYDVDVDEKGVRKPLVVILTKEIMKHGLSHVSRILAKSEYAYSCYNGQGLDLTNIDILRNYPNLKVVDLAKNRIRDCKALSSATHLMVLCVNENLIEGFDALPELPFLQTVGVSGNRFRKLEGMPTNSYTCVQLSFNKIRSLRGLNEKSCPVVTILELRGNHLINLKGLSLPTLEQLFVADNNLKHLDGIEGCPKLKLLHARDNKIASLEGFPCLEALEYVNLRNNKIEELEEVKYLGKSPNIQVLVCMSNPISELDDYREEVINAIQYLKRLDKEPLTEEEAAPEPTVDPDSQAKKEVKEVSEIPSKTSSKKETVEENRAMKGLDLKKLST